MTDVSRNQLRIETAGKIFECVESVDSRLSIGSGSWLEGDFHLRRNPFMSFSDIDLAAEASLPRIEYSSACQSVANQVKVELGFELSVSIPAIEWLSLSTAAARFLAIGEYLRQVARPEVRNRHDRRQYVLAKACLLLSRIDFKERYGPVAHRLNTPLSEKALSVKLGDGGSFEEKDADRLLSDANTYEGREFIAVCLKSHPMRDTYERYLSDLRGRIDIPDSVSNRMAEFIEKSIA